MTDDAGYGDTTFVRSKSTPGATMKTLHTHIPPILVPEPGDGWYVEVVVPPEALDALERGETVSVLAPVGDGRYWAQQNFEKIVMPALCRKPTDPRA